MSASITSIRLPKLKLTVKKEPDQSPVSTYKSRAIKRMKMTGTNKDSPYNLMNLINRLPQLQRKSANKNGNNHQLLSPELQFASGGDSDTMTPPKTPRKIGALTPPKTPQKPKTPKPTNNSNDYYERIHAALRAPRSRQDKRTPRTPYSSRRKVENLYQDNNSRNQKAKEKKRYNNNNNNHGVYEKEAARIKHRTKSIRYGKAVPKTPVDTYVRPKTKAEKSISKYVKLPPIQRAYTFATLRKQKTAANEFLAALKANYPRYDGNKYALRADAQSHLFRSRSVLSVTEHVGRHSNARLSRSKSVADVTRTRVRTKNNTVVTQYTPRTATRSKSVDPSVVSRSRPRSRPPLRESTKRRSQSRSTSVAAQLDKVLNKRSRSISVQRTFSRRKSRPLEIKQTRTSLARSKSLISIATKRGSVPPSRGGSEQPTPRGVSRSRLRRTPSLPDLRRSMSRISLVSGVLNDGDKPKKKASPLFVAIKPDNQNSEKERFLKNPNCNYSPQFRYSNPPSTNQLSKFSKASDKFLSIAIKIMKNAISKFGSYENYMEETGGRKISRYEITQAARKYLVMEGMESEVDIHLSEDLLSRARMCVIGGRPTVLIRAVNMRQNWVEGMLRHEIGTHYIRAWNNKHQLWGKAKKRQELSLEPANPTEEGIASLHSILFRKDPCLWRGALLYYTIYKASQMSFSDLFKDLGQFVKDTEVRWEYCIRAKRGYEDTSQPGAFCKDQVYLNGALQILKYRNTIDFHMLVKCGKVSWRDLPKLERLEPELQRTRIPKFMENLDVYKTELSRIMATNGLTQEDLEFV